MTVAVPFNSGGKFAGVVAGDVFAEDLVRDVLSAKVRAGGYMLPSVLGSAVYQINLLLGTLLASFLPVGSISYLYYADRLVQFPVGVFGLAVSTAALPSLSRLAAKGDMLGR